MKLSKYNFLRKYDHTTVFFNSMTCALAIVDENFLRVYNDVEHGTYDESKYDTKLIDDMKLSGCIINDDTDELQLIQFYRNQSKYDTSSLGLTIAPTLACNFRCKYCFENHPLGNMSKEIQSALIEFVKRYTQNAKDLSVTWYGGEPLIARDIVYSLSEKFLELCNLHHIDYSAFIITNGSLLTDSDIEAFKKYHIRGAQITLDGPKEIHDSRRPSCNGESSFDKLITNINNLLNNDLDVIIRVNVDKDNISYCKDLLWTLKTTIDRYDLLKIDFGKVAAFTDICRSIESSCYDAEQYADILLPLYDKVISMGFSMNKMTVYPSVKYNYCCADYVNSFVVDVDGFLYKCWNQVGMPESSCGKVNESSTSVSNNFLSWIQRTPIENKECQQCKMLPICMGGCPDLSRKTGDERPVCDTIKFNLDKVIEFYYEHLKGDVVA